MCGIFGVQGLPQAAVALTHLGLYSLQHRGQESAGIVAVDDDGDARGARKMGLVSDGFDGTTVGSLDGTLAHRAYAVQHGRLLDHRERAAGPGALPRRPHRAGAQRQPHERDGAASRARGQGSIFSSTMDSEVHRAPPCAKSSAERPRASSRRRCRASKGAYSLLVLIGNTLLAARDPRGWRPLVIGRTPDGAYVFASETCALDIVGATVDCEVEPGEIVAIDDEGFRSIKPFASAESRRCVFEYVYFARPDSRVFGGSVDRARRALGRRLAKECPAPGADLVFSVPDSSNSAAFGFAEESGLPLELALIRNHYVGRTFIQPTQAGRDAKVKVKYNAVREVLEGKSVVMVDDSIVRGTTTRGLVAMVRAAGAREVHMRVCVGADHRPVLLRDRHAEPRGADRGEHDRPRRSPRTLASTRSAICRWMGCSSPCPTGPGGFCHACFSGDYPTPPPTDPDKLQFGCGC